MKLNTLNDLYIEQIQDLYDAETQLIKALPKMAKAAHTPALQAAFDQHLKETETQAQRLEQILRQHNAKLQGKSCKGMQGLIAEGEETIKAKGEAAVLDAGLIAAAQRVEHYEMAGYGCARTYAQQLGHQEDSRLLQQTFEEELKADKKLSQLAEKVINLEAERA